MNVRKAQVVARRIITAHENMPTEQGVPIGWVNPDALLLARALLDVTEMAHTSDEPSPTGNTQEASQNQDF